MAINSVSVQASDDVRTVSAISLLAAILCNLLHEGLGYAATALLTGTKSGVLTTVAWSSDFDSRLVAGAQGRKTYGRIIADLNTKGLVLRLGDGIEAVRKPSEFPSCKIKSLP